MVPHSWGSLSNWKETQDTLERLYLSAGLRTPWYFLERAGGGGCQVEGDLEILHCCHHNLDLDRQRWMDGQVTIVLTYFTVCIHCRCPVEPLLVRCGEDDHHPRCSDHADQHSGHPPLRLEQCFSPWRAQSQVPVLHAASQHHRLPEVRNKSNGPLKHSISQRVFIAKSSLSRKMMIESRKRTNLKYGWYYDVIHQTLSASHKHIKHLFSRNCPQTTQIHPHFHPENNRLLSLLSNPARCLLIQLILVLKCKDDFWIYWLSVLLFLPFPSTFHLNDSVKPQLIITAV